MSTQAETAVASRSGSQCDLSTMFELVRLGYASTLGEVDMKNISAGVAMRYQEWVVLADEAGIVARSHPVAAEFERMMQVVPEPTGPEIPGGVPVETPPLPPDAVPGESPEEHPDSPPRENPDDIPQEMPERKGAGDLAK